MEVKPWQKWTLITLIILGFVCLILYLTNALCDGVGSWAGMSCPSSGENTQVSDAPSPNVLESAPSPIVQGPVPSPTVLGAPSPIVQGPVPSPTVLGAPSPAGACPGPAPNAQWTRWIGGACTARKFKISYTSGSSTKYVTLDGSNYITNSTSDLGYTFSWDPSVAKLTAYSPTGVSLGVLMKPGNGLIGRVKFGTPNGSTWQNALIRPVVTASKYKLTLLSFNTNAIDPENATNGWSLKETATADLNIVWIN
jgi:hypothetical protein